MEDLNQRVLTALLLFVLTACVHTPEIESQVKIDQISIPETIVAVGWETKTEILDETYHAPLGRANSPISGTTLDEIVTSFNISVRADGKACVGCHAWAQGISGRDYCRFVPFFVDAKKPLILKQVFAKWFIDGCPD